MIKTCMNAWGGGVMAPLLKMGLEELNVWFSLAGEDIDKDNKRIAEERRELDKIRRGR